MQPEQWIGLREFSRRMEKTLHAAQKAIASGRIPRAAVRYDADGKIGAVEFNLASKSWAENTDPVESARTGSPLGAVPPADDEPQAVDASKDSSGSDKKDPHGYLEARAERERFQAKQAELDYLEAIGELISKRDHRQVSSRRYRAMRDALLNVPDRIAAVLAAERDPARVHAELTKEIKRVLHELSDDARAEIARGTSERVAA